jgi:hypothetical protein
MKRTRMKMRMMKKRTKVMWRRRGQKRLERRR